MTQAGWPRKCGLGHHATEEVALGSLQPRSMAQVGRLHKCGFKYYAAEEGDAGELAARACLGSMGPRSTTQAVGRAGVSREHGAK